MNCNKFLCTTYYIQNIYNYRLVTGFFLEDITLKIKMHTFFDNISSDLFK